MGDNIESASRPEDEEESYAQSEFGTKHYWDEMYCGRGDFDAEVYSWYYGWDVIKNHWYAVTQDKSERVLVPGVGNDAILLDLHSAGWKNITAFDYSSHAICRQRDVVWNNAEAFDNIRLYVMDLRSLDKDWTESYDIILEKGTLDAVYLSCSGENDTTNLNMAVHELCRVLRPGGVFLSFSGVVPSEVRRKLFCTKKWEWIRDGSKDLKAGCFIWRKRQGKE